MIKEALKKIVKKTCPDTLRIGYVYRWSCNIDACGGDC